VKEPIAPIKVNFSINSENFMPTVSIIQVFICIDAGLSSWSRDLENPVSSSLKKFPTIYGI
jgi:hypothetical protein